MKIQIENLWSSLLALVIGISFGTAFYYVFADLINLAETPAKIFLAIIIGITMFRITLFIPIKAISQDDRGETS